MKKTILHFVMITGCALLANLSSAAQNASSETKPVKSTLKAEPAVSSAPAAPQTLQKSSEPQNTNPIVPGGEFKPRDTRTALPAAKSKEYAEPKPAMLNTSPATNTSAPVTSEAKRSAPVAAPATAPVAAPVAAPQNN